jgi:transposase
VEVLARVASEELRVVDAARIFGLSYRQGKRLWRRYREEGPEGLKQRSAGRESNRAKPQKFREKVLRLVRQKYWGEVEERFGPTLSAVVQGSRPALMRVELPGQIDQFRLSGIIENHVKFEFEF